MTLSDGAEERVRAVRSIGSDAGTVYFHGPDEVPISVLRPLAPRPGPVIIAAYAAGTWKKFELALDAGEQSFDPEPL
jgi:hypothetical protein